MFPAMFPDPLHPVVVHLPMALAVLIPGFALLGTWLIYKHFIPARNWILILLMQALLVGSGWLALETGEQEEERVERVVAENPIEAHEEAAERFLVLAGVGLIVCGAGLLPRRRGSVGRVAGTLATVVVLAAGISVGHSGGELVYKHGASNAYVAGASEMGSDHSAGRFYVGGDDDDGDDDD